MMHAVMVTELAGEFYWKCQCGERSAELFETRYEAQDAAEKHEYDGRQGKHRVPSSRPTMKTLVRLYREREKQQTYTEEEREQWKRLADEIEDQIPLDKKPTVIEGQMDLFN